MSLRTLTTLALLSLALPTLSGCKCSEDRAPAAQVQEPAKTETPALPPRVDEALLRELQAAAVDCEEGPKHITCSGGKKNALSLAFNRGERNKVRALPTFAHALTLGDPKLSALSASILYASFRLDLASGGQAPSDQDLAAEDAKALFERAIALPAQPSMQAIPSAVHAALLTKQTDLVKKALGSQVPIQVRTMALRYLMVYGRLSLFPEVQAAGKEPATAVVLAAVESPRNMKSWTAEERTAVCPWLLAFVDDKRSPVSGNAMAALAQCGSAELTILLDRLDQALKDKQLSFIHSTALRSLCGKNSADLGSQASEKQCERVRKLQEKVASSKDVQPRVRSMTLANVAYDWPDESSLKLAKKLANDEAPEVKKAAEQIIRRLEPQLKNPPGGKTPGVPSSATAPQPVAPAAPARPTAPAPASSAATP